jgi:hypothetical protein
MCADILATGATRLRRPGSAESTSSRGSTRRRRQNCAAMRRQNSAGRTSLTRTPMTMWPQRYFGACNFARPRCPGRNGWVPARLWLGTRMGWDAYGLGRVWAGTQAHRGANSATLAEFALVGASPRHPLRGHRWRGRLRRKAHRPIPATPPLPAQQAPGRR